MVRTKLVDLYIVSLRATYFSFSSIGCVLNILQAVEVGGDYMGEVCIIAGYVRYRETFYTRRSEYLVHSTYIRRHLQRSLGNYYNTNNDWTIERSNTTIMTSAVNNNNYDLIFPIIVLCPPLVLATSTTLYARRYFTGLTATASTMPLKRHLHR
jgi:hypothetical protein